MSSISNVAIGTAGLLVGFLIIWVPPLIFLAIISAITMVYILPKRAETLLLVIVLCTSTIIHEETIPRLTIGFGRIYIIDLILMLLLGVIFCRTLILKSFKTVQTPLYFPLIAFYLVGLLSTLVAIYQSSVEYREAFTALRYITYYLTFFIVTGLVNENKQVLYLVKGLLILGTLTAGITIIQLVLGNTIALIPGRIEQLITQGNFYEDVTRIITPGISVMVVGFLLSMVAVVLEKFRLLSILRILQLILLGIGVLASFHRNLWASLGLSSFLLVFIVRKSHSLRILKWGLVIIISGTLLFLFAVRDPESKITKFGIAVIERIGTLVSTKTYNTRDSTLRWRDFEYEYAFEQIQSKPLIGIGHGALYRPYLSKIDHERFDGRGYTHNGHLWILLKTGVLGYICFLWLSLSFMFRGFKFWYHIPNTQLKAVVLGSTLCYLVIFLASFAEPLIVQWNWTPIIGILMGINEVIIRNGIHA